MPLITEKGKTGVFLAVNRAHHRSWLLLFLFGAVMCVLEGLIKYLPSPDKSAMAI